MNTNEKNWFVLRTKPRNEKKVYDNILKKQIEAYLPLIPEIRIWSDRKKKILTPLFSGYVFIFGNEEERCRAITENNGAVNYVFYNKRPAIVTPQEIEFIKISIQEPQRVKVEENIIKKGDSVEIKSGIFKGLRGIVEEKRGSYKLSIRITEINYSLSLEFDFNEFQNLKKVSF